MKKCPIKAIALKPGISVSIASMALSGHPDVSEDTRLRVAPLSRELDRNSNILAESLYRKQTQVIGLKTGLKILKS